MCRLYPRDTGLQGIVINTVGRGNAVGPQLEVMIQRRTLDHVDAVVVISNCPYILDGALTPLVGRQVFRWIQRAKHILLALWEGELSCEDAGERLRRLECCSPRGA